MQQWFRWVAMAAVGLAGLGWFACERSTESNDKHAVEVTPEMQAKLVMADQVDGSVDHVVARCAGCRLGMNGVAEHTLQVGDYEMHFCSEGCRARFAANVQESVVSMTAPED